MTENRNSSPVRLQLHLRKLSAFFCRPMRSKIHGAVNLKLILLVSSALLLVVFVLRSTGSTGAAAATSHVPVVKEEESQKHVCSKIPPLLAQAIVHYSTSKDVPQQTSDEISVTARVLAQKSPCNFLVFGLGHDSLMWAALNYGGRTVFLEEDEAWIATLRRKHPALEAHHVAYDTKVSQAEELLAAGSRVRECEAVAGDAAKGGSSRCPLALKRLPGVVHETEWDLIMVDAPTGYFAEAPGRMGAIYTAGMMARARKGGETDVFVHDVNRPVEDKFSKTFLCEGYLKQQEGRLRHFTIPSHRTSKDLLPFCP